MKHFILTKDSQTSDLSCIDQIAHLQIPRFKLLITELEWQTLSCLEKFLSSVFKKKKNQTKTRLLLVFIKILILVSR